jgi:citrate synthase
MRNPSRELMNAMARAVLFAYAFDAGGNADDISIEKCLAQSIELIGQIPTIAAYAYRAKSHYHDGASLLLPNPDPRKSTAENFLMMIREDGRYTRLEAETLDLALILHAEHGGGNNSTFTTHVVTSSGTDTYSAITAAMCSLKGPKHGGANIKVMEMFADIKRNVKNWNDREELTKYLSKMLNGEVFDKKGLIYGMGHAVYSISDPRAKVFKEYVAELAKEKGKEKEYRFYTLVEEISQKLITEKKNIHKGVSANVDFYSGFAYSMLGLPIELYTPMFAIARIAGWSAHRLEELLNSGKIIRPAYISVNGRKPYIKMEYRENNDK